MISDREIALELERRAAKRERVAKLRANTLTPLSVKQRAFVEDTARRRIAVTSRQSGKTTGCLGIATLALQEPNTEHLYVAPTMDGARDPFWQRLKVHCESHGIQHVPNETRLELRIPEKNSVIYLRGVPDVVRANRLLGPTRTSAIIDECASYPDAVLKTLVTKVLEPSLMVKRGSLVMVGTPGMQPKGFFYECTKSAGFSQHRWDMHDNPVYRGEVAEIHQGILESNGWTQDTPTFRREYLGEWCADTEAAVYRVTDANLYGELPQGEWRHVLGVDFGYRDEAAFVVVGWREHDPTLYVVYEDSAQELLVDDYVARIREIVKRFAPIAIVADAGALGKTLTETLVHNHGIPIEAADKRDKPVAIRQVNADLFKGRIRLPPSGLFEQMQTLRWHPDKIGLFEQPGMPNDRCDAMLYAYRRAFHFLQKPAPPRIEHGTTEYFAKIERDIREQHERESMRDPFALDPWSTD